MPNVIQKKNGDDVVYVHINKKTKKGKYIILPEYSQHKYCEKVLLEGFDRLPSGFYTKDGIGLTGAGNFILQEISGKYGGSSRSRRAASLGSTGGAARSRLRFLMLPLPTSTLT